MCLGQYSRSWCRCLLLLAATAGWLAPAREVQAQPNARVTLSPGGAASYLPDRWGTVELQFTNLDDQPAELFAATYFDQDRTLQFGRKAWVPAKARLTLSHPIRIPSLEEGQRVFDLSTILLDPHQEDEVLLRGGSGDLQLKGTPLRLGEEPSTAMINLVEELPKPGSRGELPYELVVAAKSAELLGRKMAQLNDAILPATPEAYSSIDQIIVADNRLTSDGPAISAIRRWLFAGGHLWVLLDRVDPQLLELLLGDGFPCQVVDRVELTTVRIEPTGRTAGSKASVRDYDHAVAMARVLVSDVEVACTVEGWPAAFWKQCGEGKLLVTTLAPDGWMRQGITAEEAGPITRSAPGRSAAPAPGRDPISPSSKNGSPAPGPTAGSGGPPGPSPQVGPPLQPPPPSPPPLPADPQEAALLQNAKGRTYFVVPPMKDLATEFFSPRTPPLFQPAILEPHVQEYVGTSVPSRWLITSMLVGFGALLAGVGSVLWRASRLEWLGVGGPALAVGVSAVLMVMGMAQRRSVPPTVATVQFVEPVPGTNDVRVAGVTDIYAPSAKGTVIASQGGGWILPDRSGQEGQTARMIWSDMDAWEWKHLPPMAGQRLAVFSTARQTTERLQAKATFGPGGLTGRLNGVGDHPQDAVLATRDGRIGVNLNSDGSFAAPASQILTGEQFIAADLLSDEQNRRSRTLAALFANSQKSNFPQVPTLLVWVDPLDLGFRFDEGHRQLGSALVAAPLELERPPAGTEVAIPSPFLPYRTVQAPDDGSAASGLYDYRRREWQDRANASSAWLRFQVPDVLLPLEPLRAKITVQVTGPVGKLEIAGLRGKEAVPLKTWIDPVGTLSVEIADPALLQVVNGGLLLKVSGGVLAFPALTTSSGKVNYWRIESLRLDLDAKTASSKPVQPEKEPQ